jgi:hypothetical protein
MRACLQEAGEMVKQWTCLLAEGDESEYRGDLFQEYFDARMIVNSGSAKKDDEAKAA